MSISDKVKKAIDYTVKTAKESVFAGNFSKPTGEDNPSTFVPLNPSQVEKKWTKGVLPSGQKIKVEKHTGETVKISDEEFNRL